MKIPLAILLLVPLAAADPLDLRMVPRATCDPVTLTDESGTFSTPHHPDNYPNNVNCTWLIFVPADRIVRLQFTTFSTEPMADFVQVFDGPGSTFPLLVNHTGEGLPDPDVFLATRNAMFVRFTSDQFVQRSGFQANYTAVLATSNDTTTSSPATLPPDFSCGGAVIGSGVIVSPNHPNLYDANLNCTWFIQSKSELVTVNFTTFMTEAKVDYVQIWDGWDAGAALLATLSGNLMADLPLAVTSPTGNKLTIHFVTDDSVEKEGFVVFYS